jgi:uncharacterized protein YndB with AHSA1/START domain
MKVQTPVSVRLTRRYEATPERVFDAFLDPERARKFLFHKPTAKMIRAEIDARVGGKFAFVDRREGEDVEFAGQYLEIERPRRLVFSLNVKSVAMQGDRVVIEIAPQGKGCELTLIHEINPALAEFESRIEQGWIGIFDELVKVL